MENGNGNGIGNGNGNVNEDNDGWGTWPTTPTKEDVIAQLEEVSDMQSRLGGLHCIKDGWELLGREQRALLFSRFLQDMKDKEAAERLGHSDQEVPLLRIKKALESEIVCLAFQLGLPFD